MSFASREHTPLARGVLLSTRTAGILACSFPFVSENKGAGKDACGTNGIEIQTYVAIIACLLIALWTGRKATLRTYEMLCFYMSGLADEEELLAHIEKLQPQD